MLRFGNAGRSDEFMPNESIRKNKVAGNSTTTSPRLRSGVKMLADQ
jgi:hypothetical protein